MQYLIDKLFTVYNYIYIHIILSVCVYIYIFTIVATIVVKSRIIYIYIYNLFRKSAIYSICMHISHIYIYIIMLMIFLSVLFVGPRTERLHTYIYI